jgi:hypothetical protein|tara:strand:- start:748 stop:858 length:111 start_codon:yes stop_codon:yes gene_type:complete
MLGQKDKSCAGIQAKGKTLAENPKKQGGPVKRKRVL